MKKVYKFSPEKTVEIGVWSRSC